MSTQSQSKPLEVYFSVYGSAHTNPVILSISGTTCPAPTLQSPSTPTSRYTSPSPISSSTSPTQLTPPPSTSGASTPTLYSSRSSRSPPEMHNHSMYVQTDKGIYYRDEGEKDRNGNVMILKDPCEDCGGEVVWATKGPWLLICRDCGEIQ